MPSASFTTFRSSSGTAFSSARQRRPGPRTRTWGPSPSDLSVFVRPSDEAGRPARTGRRR
jgi:hypothetical protein